MDGVRFPDNKQKKFTTPGPDLRHAVPPASREGRWANIGETDDDPEGEAHGPVWCSAAVRPHHREDDRRGRPSGSSALRRSGVSPASSFDGAAQAAIDEGHPKMRIHIAHIRPDVNPGMNGLLKEHPAASCSPSSAALGTKVNPPDGEGMSPSRWRAWTSRSGEQTPYGHRARRKVAAWFVDSDYDGRHVLHHAGVLSATVALGKSSARRLPVSWTRKRFEFSRHCFVAIRAGKHKSVAVKVIDPRGNEVMRVHALGGDGR